MNSTNASDDISVADSWETDDMSTPGATPRLIQDADASMPVVLSLDTSITAGRRARSLTDLDTNTIGVYYTQARALAKSRKKQELLNRAWLQGMRDQQLAAYQELHDSEMKAAEELRRLAVKKAREQVALKYQRSILLVIVTIGIILLCWYLWWCSRLGPEFAFLRNMRIEKLALKLGADEEL